MSETVRQEAALFLASMGTGLVLICFYDIFRILRRLIPHTPLAVGLEDIVYWIAAGFLIFAMLFEKNKGALRGCAFAGILLGVWLEAAAESFLRKMWIKLLKKVGKRGTMTTGT